jgi:hypothetical protein
MAAGFGNVCNIGCFIAKEKFFQVTAVAAILQ